MVVCGGVSNTVTHLVISGFNQLLAMSVNPDPETAARPFTKNRDGFIMGEGGGTVIIESEESAKARSAKIYCELAGASMCSEAHNLTAPKTDGAGMALSMRMALSDAGMSPDEIDYINAHGTSTGLNDKYETAAIKLALGEKDARRVKISSTKSMIGHLLGAAGAVEAVVCAKSVQEGFIHGTVGYKVPDEECDLDYCGNGNIKQEVNVVLSNSLGFGGHNATLCFRKVKD